MRHLFSPEGEAALVAALQYQPLLAFDFDGTLAPIVPRPGDARVSRAVAGRLSQLMRWLPVAIVTGRRVEDVRERLGFVPSYVVGNHGAEDEADPAVGQALCEALDSARELLLQREPVLKAAGVSVEDKQQSIALHYRLARDRDRARQVIDEVLEGLGPTLTVFGGKLVVNLTPADAPDKAHAVRTLVARSGAGGALFAGDDLNDEPVFAAAAPHWLTIKIGREPAHTRAAFFLENPAEMALLLERILGLVPKLLAR
ncbi:trehalose-phosphatase [Ideonella benzenivorans]|uniref:trehalose-phosphatase n=1 Tax=Ideonella benzenivorans TaxID=2831643 RepID=UPI001CED260A|nr:trehalose-phosphatase [Ideonella benzenivorans]